MVNSIKKTNVSAGRGNAFHADLSTSRIVTTVRRKPQRHAVRNENLSGVLM